ncbi:MAG: response regulator transcription factor [Candidatus Acidiferrum sp.]
MDKALWMDTGVPTMRILIADDSDIVRRGVVRILSSVRKWEVCGEARDGAEALRKARELLPDLILLDISMPGLNGLEVARHLRQEVPGAKIVVISQHDPIQLLPSALEAGAHACVDKSRLDPDLVATMESIGGFSEAR